MTHQEAIDTLASDRYLLDEMSDGERDTFEDHYFSCTECAEEIRSAEAMIAGAKAGLAGGSTGGRVVSMAGAASRRPIWYQSVALPWAVAATLAILAGYQSARVVPSLRRDASLMALAPVTLRPESRGSEPVVPPAGPGRPITLAIDVNDAPPDGELTYALTKADGTQLVSGRASAPKPGTPLFLLIPDSTQVTPAHYILTVQNAATNHPLGEYRFEVAAQ
jgi:hypothetical protein